MTEKRAELLYAAAIIATDRFSHHDDPLTVDGAAYTVREVKLQDDGRFAIVYLSKV